MGRVFPLIGEKGLISGNSEQVGTINESMRYLF